jgi:hypothetical protein
LNLTDSFRSRASVASTPKAAANALAVDALAQTNNDVIAAWALWQPDQIWLGLHHLRQGNILRDRSQFSHSRTTGA